MKSEAGTGATAALACTAWAGKASPISARAAASVGAATLGRTVGKAGADSAGVFVTNAAALTAAPFRNRRRPTPGFFALPVRSDTVHLLKFRKSYSKRRRSAITFDTVGALSERPGRSQTASTTRIQRGQNT